MRCGVLGLLLRPTPSDGLLGTNEIMGGLVRPNEGASAGSGNQRSMLAHVNLNGCPAGK